MPCSAWGSATSAISPPSASIVSSVASKTSRTPGVDRVAAPARRARRSAGRSRSSRSGQARRPPSSPTEVESQGSLPLQDRQQQGGVADVAGQRPALVERGGEGDHPVARDRAVGGLQPDDAAERRGLADRAAGVGADRPGRQAAGDDRRRAAGGAARHPAAVPGVEHRPVGRVLVRGAHRELVHVGLAEDRRAGLDQAAAPRSPCRAAGSPRGSASRRWSARPRCRRCP